MKNEILVVGAGCAGLTAAVYAARAGRTVLVLESSGVGGQISEAPQVENYPGIAKISGMAFADALCAQAQSFGAELDFAAVEAVERTADGFRVRTDDGESRLCRSVILACGTRRKRLGIAREEELSGHGVSYCAQCDGAFYKGADVAVVGGGSSALQSAELLSGLCRSVTLIHRRSRLRGEEMLARRLQGKPNVRFLLSSTVTALRGERELSGVEVTDAAGGRQTLPVSGLFVLVGQHPANDRFAELVRLDEDGYIDAGEDCKTSCPGVFAAGDCRRKAVRQLTTAAADGTAAALAACDYLAGLPASGPGSSL